MEAVASRIMTSNAGSGHWKPDVQRLSFCLMTDSGASSDQNGGRDGGRDFVSRCNSIGIPSRGDQDVADCSLMSGSPVDKVLLLSGNLEAVSHLLSIRDSWESFLFSLYILLYYFSLMEYI